ncbi:uncharacterized protein LOC131851347 [Achroia grisella]|uniref:uncharacterized protein LOC131851347 n=1 Tax=Achroia grisella TaxID=688607 RepID=UPI0027D1FBD6|nr:uncharacterized protein LOC131851347 [Achroia grisella]
MGIIQSIRKFGLDYCDLPTMVWNIGVMLRLVTLNVDPRHKKGIPIIFYIITFLTACSFYYAYLISSLWFLFVRTRETKNMVLGMVGFSISLCSEIGPTKLFFLIMNRKEIRTLIGKCLELDSHVIPGSRFHKNLMKKMRNVKKRYMFFWTVVTCNGLLYIIRPIFLSGRHSLDDNFVYYGLEPILETPNYEISYIIGTTSTIYVLHLTTNITGLLITLTGYAESQIISLGEEFQELWNDAEKHYQEIARTNDAPETTNDERAINIKNEYIKRQLHHLINMHIATTQILRDTELVFRGALAAEFVLLILSLIAELLGGLNNTYLQVVYGFIIVGMDCLAGQRIMDAGVTFQKSVYECNWENFNARNMKTIWMIILNSQKPLNLSAGGLAMLNLGILMTFARSIYSAYTAFSSRVSH